jgi:hypothetical protein
VSNATQAIQFFEPVLPPLDDGDAAALSLAAALSDAAALGADVAAPPPLEHAAKMKAAVAPSDSNRMELRNVSLLLVRPLGRCPDPRSFGRGGYAIRPAPSMTSNGPTREAG